jgi:hypothetical protein
MTETEHSLILRATVIGGETAPGDYCVFREGYSIGRIRFAKERIGHNPGWDWHVNPPLPVPAWCSGAEEMLEAAMASFREAWVRFYATLEPSDIDHWHNAVEGLLERERNRGKPPKPYSSMMLCVCGVKFDSHKPDESWDHRGHIYAAQARGERC